MNHCPVTADLNAYLAKESKEVAREELIDSKLDSMMRDVDLVASIVDDVIGASDHGNNGCTEIANDLAAIVTDEDIFSAASDADKFRLKLTELVRTRMRLDAETEVADEIAREEEFKLNCRDGFE